MSVACLCICLFFSHRPFICARLPQTLYLKPRKSMVTFMKKALNFLGRALCQAGWLLQRFSHTHRGVFASAEKGQCGETVLIKAGFFSPKPLSLASLIITFVPTCRYVVPPISWPWLQCSGGQNHSAFLFLLPWEFSKEAADWLPGFQLIRVG